MFSTIRTAILAVCVGLVAGFGVGYFFAHNSEKASIVERIQEEQKQTAENIQESLETSQITEAKITQKQRVISSIRKEVAAHLKTEQNEIKPESSCSNTLDAGTVWLLNAARAGTAPDTSGSSDGESKAPSDVGTADLIDNDLEVVGMYHELAERHSALVDYVQGVVDKQLSER